MSEQEQKPTYDALWSKVFTLAETIDTLEARLQNAEEDERAALQDYQRERARREQLEQQLAQARDKLDESEGTVASLRISLWETLHQLEEAQALLEEAAIYANDTGSPAYEQKIRAFLADKEQHNG